MTGKFTHLKRSIALAVSFVLIVVFSCLPAFATCGGGGGGGVGGMSGGGGGTAQVYYVPWKARKATDPAPMGLIVYWFPLNQEELKKSSMLESRILSLYATQCVSMELADYRVPAAAKLIGESKPPLAMIVEHDGTFVSKIENREGKLKVTDVEKVVKSEVDKRESALETSLKDAQEKAKAGDKDAAIKLFRAVYEQKCMFPKKAKEAVKELKKLGVGDVAEVPAAPNFDPRVNARIQQTMRAGLIAENAGKYLTAKKFYRQANLIDPADPTPLRYLGELYRHHTGEWDKARTTFETILNMPADDLSRAVAQHGLGKMTIHDGEFKKGLSLMEDAAETYPLALTYRNLAVYWNSEGDMAKTEEYINKALAMDPKDAYNLVFAAVFSAMIGRGDEALKIARENEKLLPASYNLAAIYAQLGQKEKALALLKRHFFQYERYQAVREKEMMEARVDAVFDSLRADKAFLALTGGADGKLPMPMPKATSMPMKMQ